MRSFLFLLWLSAFAPVILIAGTTSLAPQDPDRQEQVMAAR